MISSLHSLIRVSALFAVLSLSIGQAHSAQSYMEDADGSNPPAPNSGAPLINGHNWPRLILAETQSFAGNNDERFSKFHVIATQAAIMDQVATLQARYPQLMYFRMLNPHSYLSYNDEDKGVQCSQSHGIPFGGTAASTGDCNVYAGHWLYQPGTLTTQTINSSQTSVRVNDASRFTPGHYAVIYNAPAGSFGNAEHVKITARDNSTNTLTIQRGYKSQAHSHGSNSIIAQHSVGDTKSNDRRNWVYNMSTQSPRDGANRRYIDYLSNWFAQNYKKDRLGRTVNINVSGFLFDTDFHFETESAKADVNNDLVLDDGLGGGGVNWYGDGVDFFYSRLRTSFPNLIIVGGVRNSRGFSHINGVQMEGFPSYSDFKNENPDYTRMSTLLAMYTYQSRHRVNGPAHTHVLNKTPTRLYPFEAATQPSTNAPFRLAFGMTLLEDGYFGYQNTSSYPDIWFDEYAVDVTPGSANYGRAVTSNPNNEAQIRAHMGWLGKPTGLRQRLYSDTEFAPNKSLISNGTFDSNINGWSGKRLTVSRRTGGSNVKDGSGALHATQHSPYQRDFWETQIKSPPVTVTRNTQYTLVFSAKSSIIREISVGVGGHGERFMLGPQWQRFVVPFTAKNNSTAPINFNVGRENSEIWLDSVHVFEGNANVFRRDFDNGIVVVNATPNSRTINLNGTFERINGTQDNVNNGATVTSITLPAHDSAVLVKPDNITTVNDTKKPVPQIIAPTKTSSQTITDTTIVVTDDVAILASAVALRSDNTAEASNLNCTQTNTKQVDCTIEINSSGDLKITTMDVAGNLANLDENGYVINPVIPDFQLPVLQIIAPTKTSSQTITDTTIVVTDNQSILADTVALRADNTAGTSNLNCTQTDAKRVDCTIEINSSGDLKITAADAFGNVANLDENGYVIESVTPDTNKPIPQIIAPTKTSTQAITDTTIVVTDDVAILASAVALRSDNTAEASNLNCTQTNTKQVDCTLQINSSGDLKITTMDVAGNIANLDENGYVINPIIPDLLKPTLQITAPTKTSSQTITDTTIVATDNIAILASSVTLRADNTADTSNLNCTQTDEKRVDCTIEINSSGDLKITATDAAGNVANLDENGYVINPITPDTEKPVLQIIAPTKTSSQTITDTTIVVTDNEAILASTVMLRSSNTVDASNLSCTQTNEKRVDCTIEINSSGDLKISATDVAGNVANLNENGYVINIITPDTEKPVLQIIAPTKTSTQAITDTTIVVTDNVAVLADTVMLRSDNTAGALNLNCLQTNEKRVDCTIEIIGSGDLKISATDTADNVANLDENGYVIEPITPDILNPTIRITAPTKTSTSIITDTTILITDAVGVLANTVMLRGDNTAETANLNCTQINSKRVECSIYVISSGNLRVKASDTTGNVGNRNEDGYMIESVTPDILSPAIQITAPTKTSTQAITDTTILVTDNVAVLADAVMLRTGNTADVSDLNCTQINVKQVDCTIKINSSGNLRVKATDTTGNVGNRNEDGYVIEPVTPDIQKPAIKITAPVKKNASIITDTTIQITDNEGILANTVVLRPDNTVETSNLVCLQTNTKQVDCTIEIFSSGNLRIRATDKAGNIGNRFEDDYILDLNSAVSPTTSGAVIDRISGTLKILLLED